MSTHPSTAASRFRTVLAGCSGLLGLLSCEREAVPLLPDAWVSNQKGVLVFLIRGEDQPLEVVAHDLDAGALNIVPESDYASVRVHIYDTPLSTYLETLGPQKHADDGRPIPFTDAQYELKLDGDGELAWQAASPSEVVSAFRLRGPGACTSFDVTNGERINLGGPAVAAVSSARMGIPSAVVSSATLQRAEVGLDLSARPLDPLELPAEAPGGLQLRSMKSHTIGRTYYLTEGWFVREGEGSTRAWRSPYGSIVAGDASAGVANFYNFIIAEDGGLYLHQENEDEWTHVGASAPPLTDGTLVVLTGEGSLSFVATDPARHFVIGSPSALSQGELEIQGAPAVISRLAGTIYVVSDRGEVVESSSDGGFRQVFSIPVPPQRVGAAVAFHRGLAPNASWFLGLDDGSVLEYRPDGRLCPPVSVLQGAVARLVPRLAEPSSTVVEEILVIGGFGDADGAEVARMTARR